MVERPGAAPKPQNKRLQEQLATVQDEERADLARDLHDEIGPMLFAADVDAAAIERLAERGEYERHPAARRHHPRGHRPDAAARARHPRAPAPGRAARRRAGACHRQSRVVLARAPARPRISDVDVPEEGFGEPLDGTIYRIVQESLSNAVRHGNPSAHRDRGRGRRRPRDRHPRHRRRRRPQGRTAARAASASSACRSGSRASAARSKSRTAPTAAASSSRRACRPLTAERAERAEAPQEIVLQ